MKKLLILIALMAFTTLCFSQNKVVNAVKADTTGLTITKEQAVKLLVIINVAMKTAPHSKEITAENLTALQEAAKELAPLLFNKYFNKDGSPKKQ